MASSAFQSPTSPANASQAQQEAGSSTSVYVSPGVQQYHPSASKAWVNFNGTGTVAIRTSYNVTSITDNGTADYTVNFTNAMSSANYSAVGSVQPASSDNGSAEAFGLFTVNASASPTASALRMLIRSARSAYILSDHPAIYVAVFGDQ